MENTTFLVKQLLSVLSLSLVSFYGFSETYNVSTGEELVTALTNAVAGDEILLASGTYTTDRKAQSYPTADGDDFWKSFFFLGTNDGTATNPITIKSADISNPAVLMGNGPANSGYVLLLTGDYWVVENIKIESGAKGIIIDNSNYTTIKDVEIYNIGQEAIHVRDGSSNTLIDGVNLHDIGTLNDGFGEGIYVGSDNAVWWEGDGINTGENRLQYKRACNNTTVINSTIGPNITAEPFDIKEGTENTVVENCVIYGTGISGQNFADSHIDLKGNKAKIRCNTFYQNENMGILRAIMIVPRLTAGVPAEFTANDNIVHDNTFYLESAGTDVLVANSGAAFTYAWNNTRVPEDGDFYNNRITEETPNDYSYECGVTLNNDSFEEEINSAIQVVMFPNPFTEKIQLNFGELAILDIKVYDQLGRIVETYSKNQIEANMEVGEKLNTGIYYVKVNSNVGFKTFVINKY